MAFVSAFTPRFSADTASRAVSRPTAIPRHTVAPTRKNSTTAVNAKLSIPPANQIKEALATAAKRALAASVALSLVLHPGAPPQDFELANAFSQPNIGFRGSSNAVNKDAESLLRWGLPIKNKEIRELQSTLEGIERDMRSLKWNKVSDDVKKSQGIIRNKAAAMLKDIPAERADAATEKFTEIQAIFPDLIAAVDEKDAEQVETMKRIILNKVGDVEQMMMVGFPYEVPKEYSNLPQLKGRAVVEMTLDRPSGEPFNIDGVLYDKIDVKMVIDGYNAPVTAGNFVDLVKKGFYNNLAITRSDGFVIQSGDPDGDGPVEGYVDPATKQLRTIPLEVFALGDKEPTYGTTLEDDGRGAAQTVMPFSSYGTLAFAREEFIPDSGSSQFFFFLFEPDLTPAGRNLLDGRYCVFGYTVENAGLLKDVKVGDVITSARLVAGEENLVLPSSS